MDTELGLKRRRHGPAGWTPRIGTTPPLLPELGQYEGGQVAWANFFCLRQMPARLRTPQTSGGDAKLRLGPESAGEPQAGANKPLHFSSTPTSLFEDGRRDLDGICSDEPARPFGLAAA